jgi:hypothetical protein
MLGRLRNELERRKAAMKLANVALVSTTLLALLAVGCRHDASEDTSEGGSIATSEAQLLEDDSEATSVDDDLESSVDEPLSGGDVSDPGTPADGASDDELLEKVRTNAGKFFKPAGCLTSTRDGNKITHVFEGCTGPYGFRSFDGTVTATYAREPGKLTVTLDANGFKANGAQISGERVIVYERSGTVITKTRTGNWTGTSEKGKVMAHTASFKTTYDASTKCLTRDGTAQTTIGGRSHERVIDGYKRCGIGNLGCPESGTITLTRTKGGESLSVVIELEGGVHYSVTRPNGKKVERTLICKAS